MTFPLHVRLKLFSISGHSRRDYFVQGRTGVFGYIRDVHFPARPCITRSTLHRHVTSPPRGPIRKIALARKEEEEILVSFLRKFANRGVPLIRRHLQDALKILVNSMDPARRYMLLFRNGVPGRAFLRAFRRRHEAELSFSKPLSQEAVRFAQVNSEVLSTHFVL